jgi:hypothetical protein
MNLWSLIDFCAKNTKDDLLCKCAWYMGQPSYDIVVPAYLKSHTKFSLEKVNWT